MDGKIQDHFVGREASANSPAQDDHSVMYDDQENKEIHEVTAIFVGLVDLDAGLHALFMFNCPNEERRDERPAFFSAFAAAVPPDYFSSSKKFTIGVLYRFNTQYSPLAEGVYSIYSSLADVTCLLPTDKFIGRGPVIRGSFTGSEGNFMIFKPSELPPVQFNGEPIIKVLQSQVISLPSFRLRNDCLLRTRTGLNATGRPFACVADITSTIHMGAISAVPIRDIPPQEFVISICAKFQIQLLIGGEDFPELPCPCISNRELLGLGNIAEISSFNEFFSFAKMTLKKKYGGINTPTGVLSKVNSFIENEGVRDSSRHTLIWANMQEGLQIGIAHLLSRLLNQSNCRPLVITSANGLTMCVPDDYPLEVNPETFPPHLYGQVSIVSGCVSVLNDSLNGKKKTNRGSRNTVRYLVGYPHPKPKRPFEAIAVVPATNIALGVDGTYPVPLADGSDDKRISPLSMVAILQTRKVQQLTSALDSQRNCSFEILRATSPGRWTTINVRPHRSEDNENLKKMLVSKHVFYYPVSLVTRPSCGGGVGLLKVNPSFSYLKNTPLHLDYIDKFRFTEEGKNQNEKPIFFPVSDTFIKIIFPDDSHFPSFISFLKEANRRVKNTWFSALRFNGIDTNLFIGREFIPRAMSSVGHRPERTGNFIVIEGLHLCSDTDSIISHVSKIIGVKRSFWGKSFDYQHRFIIETTTPLGEIGNWKDSIPEKIFGVNVDICLTDSVEEWSNAHGNVKGPLKFLSDAPPELQGAIKDLFNDTDKRFNIEPAANDNQNFSEHPEKKQMSDPSDDISRAPPKKVSRDPSSSREAGALSGGPPSTPSRSSGPKTGKDGLPKEPSTRARRKKKPSSKYFTASDSSSSEENIGGGAPPSQGPKDKRASSAPTEKPTEGSIDWSVLYNPSSEDDDDGNIEDIPRSPVSSPENEPVAVFKTPAPRPPRRGASSRGAARQPGVEKQGKGEGKKNGKHKQRRLYVSPPRNPPKEPKSSSNPPPSDTPTNQLTTAITNASSPATGSTHAPSASLEGSLAPSSSSPDAAPAPETSKLAEKSQNEGSPPSSSPLPTVMSDNSVDNVEGISPGEITHDFIVWGTVNASGVLKDKISISKRGHDQMQSGGDGLPDGHGVVEDVNEEDVDDGVAGSSSPTKRRVVETRMEQ